MYANATFIGASELSSHIIDSINQMQTRDEALRCYLCRRRRYSRRALLLSAQYLTFFQAEKITVSRGLRLTQVKARNVYCRSRTGSVVTSVGRLRKCDRIYWAKS